jgi:hypothetical protein
MILKIGSRRAFRLAIPHVKRETRRKKQSTAEISERMGKLFAGAKKTRMFVAQAIFLSLVQLSIIRSLLIRVVNLSLARRVRVLNFLRELCSTTQR